MPYYIPYYIKERKNMKEKELNFKNLANSRVNKAIKILRLISNLSNKSHYSYSQEEADKIVAALNNEVKNIREKFNSKNSRDTKEFKL